MLKILVPRRKGKFYLIALTLNLGFRMDGKLRERRWVKDNEVGYREITGGRGRGSHLAKGACTALKRCVDAGVTPPNCSLFRSTPAASPKSAISGQRLGHFEALKSAKIQTDVMIWGSFRPPGACGQVKDLK